MFLREALCPRVTYTRAHTGADCVINISSSRLSHSLPFSVSVSGYNAVVANEDGIRNEHRTCRRIGDTHTQHETSERSESQSEPCSAEEVDTNSGVGRGKGRQEECAIVLRLAANRTLLLRLPPLPGTNLSISFLPARRSCRSITVLTVCYHYRGAISFAIIKFSRSAWNA